MVIPGIPRHTHLGRAPRALVLTRYPLRGSECSGRGMAWRLTAALVSRPARPHVQTRLNQTIFYYSLTLVWPPSEVPTPFFVPFTHLCFPPANATIDRLWTKSLLLIRAISDTERPAPSDLSFCKVSHYFPYQPDGRPTSKMDGKRHPSSFQQLEKLGEGTYATVS